ncbi:2OG-Fe dioxygenase family protein [Streptomyces sp. NPDC006430]|uniref:2OG-Fe dioxygenase family protein n=1 Tax=Streptomyces sp. NPDC006430 TaxID=3154299 RepID=UPI0033BE3637
MDPDTGFLDPADENAAAAEEAARAALVGTGAYLLPPADVLACLSADASSWAHFAAHWEDLTEDEYAARRGARRLRRYGHFSLSPGTGELRLLPHTGFVQPGSTNPLYESVDRHFDPLTGNFVSDPTLRQIIGLLARVAAVLDVPEWWSVKVHPFRVVATAEGGGEPTPEGRHQDGVTLVSSLFIGRDNATGGESTVYTPEGDEILSVTLCEPASLLVSDDRGLLHGVSPVRPVDATRTAHRDVLVTTLTPADRADLS